MNLFTFAEMNFWCIGLTSAFVSFGSQIPQRIWDENHEKNCQKLHDFGEWREKNYLKRSHQGNPSIPNGNLWLGWRPFNPPLVVYIMIHFCFHKQHMIIYKYFPSIGPFVDLATLSWELGYSRCINNFEAFFFKYFNSKSSIFLEVVGQAEHGANIYKILHNSWSITFKK